MICEPTQKIGSVVEMGGFPILQNLLQMRQQRLCQGRKFGKTDNDRTGIVTLRKLIQVVKVLCQKWLAVPVVVRRPLYVLICVTFKEILFRKSRILFFRCWLLVVRRLNIRAVLFYYIAGFMEI